MLMNQHLQVLSSVRRTWQAAPPGTWRIRWCHGWSGCGFLWSANTASGLDSDNRGQSGQLQGRCWDSPVYGTTHHVTQSAVLIL